jgi:4-diphosphocytidyl-2-C-methyl-D-erythritol kinase
LELRTVTKNDDGTYSAAALAKLNISLSIGKADENGMHEISSVMQAVSLHDRIRLKVVNQGEEGIEGHVVKDDIIAKAIEELSEEVGKKLYCRINASKTIPMAAGLAGGSSDAAAILRIANTAFGLGMDAKSLGKVAQKVGNDVSFLLHGGRANVSGKNQGLVEPLAVPDLHYLIARPRMKLSTKEMYALHDKTGKDFTQLASELCSDTGKLLSEMAGDAVESGVTGKGPTVFAGYRTYDECKAVSGRILWLDGDMFIERAVGAYF